MLCSGLMGSVNEPASHSLSPQGKVERVSGNTTHNSETIFKNKIGSNNKNNLVKDAGQGTPNWKPKAVLYSKEIEKLALGISEEDKPFEVKRTLAAGFHELLLNKRNIHSLKRLDRLLRSFLYDPTMKESGVQTQLTINIGSIVTNYFTNIDI